MCFRNRISPAFFLPLFKNLQVLNIIGEVGQERMVLTLRLAHANEKENAEKMHSASHEGNFKADLDLFLKIRMASHS